jgi:hypothetical protein
MSEEHENVFRTPMDPSVRAALDNNKSPVPMTERQVAELYNMAEVTVTWPDGRVQRKMAQVGGAVLTGTQLGEHFQKCNQFPGAKEIRIRMTNSRVPLKTVEDQIKRVKSTRLAPAVKTTPKAVVEEPTIVVDGQPRRLKLAGPTTPEAVVETESEALETGQEEFFEGQEGAEAEEAVETAEEAVEDEPVPPPVSPQKRPRR